MSPCMGLSILTCSSVRKVRGEGTYELRARERMDEGWPPSGKIEPNLVGIRSNAQKT